MRSRRWRRRSRPRAIEPRRARSASRPNGRSAVPEAGRYHRPRRGAPSSSGGGEDVMFGIGPQELLLILVIALIVVGPRRLPEMARSIGKGLREVRKAQDEVRKTIQVNLDEPAPRPPSARTPPATEDAEAPGEAPVVS